MPETGIRYDQHQRIIDGNGKILVTNPDNPATGGYVTENQLKEWIEDVVSYPSASQFPSTGEDGRLYIAKDTNTLYRWDGNAYVSVSADTSALEERVDTLEAQVEGLNTEVSTLKEKNARQDAEIKTLQLMAEGTIGAKDTQSLDGYTVDVKARGVSGKVVVYGLLDEMEGRDVCRNQLINGYAFTNPKTSCRPTRSVVSVGNHIVFSYAEVKCGGGSSALLSGVAIGAEPSTSSPNWTVLESVQTVRSGGFTGLYPRVDFSGATDYSDCDVRQLWYVDLTQMFPTDTPTTLSDPRIADVKAYLAEHPQYNAGQIVNNAVTSVVSEGRNLWNEEWEVGSISWIGGPVGASDRIRTKNPIEILPSTQYCVICSDRVQLFYYDSTDTFIRYEQSTKGNLETFTTPQNARYARFYARVNYGTTYKNDIAIIKGTTGTYTPYRPPVTLSLPSICAGLHGLPSARDRLSFVNRVYENMKAVDLGTVNWSYDSTYQFFYSNDIDVTNYALLSNRYPLREGNGAMVGIQSDASDKWMGTNAPEITVGQSGYIPRHRLIIKDTAYTDASAFKASLSGVILHYEATSGGEMYEARVLEVNTVQGNLDGMSNWQYLADSGFWYPTTNKLWSLFGNQTYSVGQTEFISECGASGFQSLSSNLLRVYSTDGVNPPHGRFVCKTRAPQLLDITDQLPAEQPLIEVEDGGTLTFVNENKVATPSTMTFPVQLGGTT